LRKGGVKREIYLVRHGETKWSKSGQHTGLSDILLTDQGKEEAKHLGQRLEGLFFDHVFTSPLKRAFETCQLCNLSQKATVSDALLEWNYGDYEGMTSKEIHKSEPTWNVFEKGAPGGESTGDVKTRVDEFLKKLEALEGKIALFSSGHISRALTVRFLGFPLAKGRHFILSTASLSILSYEHGKPALKLWNDVSHHE